MKKKRKSVAPLVLCDNYDFKYPFLTGGNMCNAVVFPAYENDYVYGVMVVTSSKYDFFENGYAFYESSIMDFTSALISDRLYLQTEDMAKRMVLQRSTTVFTSISSILNLKKRLTVWRYIHCLYA